MMENVLHIEVYKQPNTIYKMAWWWFIVAIIVAFVVADPFGPDNYGAKNFQGGFAGGGF